MILANVRSLRNKLDELQANITHLHEYRTASILAFTETWMNNNDGDKMLHIDGFDETGQRQRAHARTTWRRRLSLCELSLVLCGCGEVREKLCTTDIELLAVSFRLF